LAALVLGAIAAAVLFLGGGGPNRPASTPTTVPPVARMGGRLVRIDPITNKITGTFHVGTSASSVAVGDGAVWVVDDKSQDLVKVDPSSGKVKARIPVGKDPSAVAVGEGAVWVANAGDGTVDRIDPSSESVVARIRVEPGPNLIAAGDGVVVVTGALAGQPGGFTELIDPATNEARPIEGYVAGLTAGDGKIWLVSYSGGGYKNQPSIKTDLYRLDPAKDRGVYVGTFIVTSGGIERPPALAVGDGVAWEKVIETSNQIRPMSTSTGKPGQIITVGTFPIGLALDGIGGLWVLNQGDGSVWKISTQSRQTTAVITVGRLLTGIAADANGVWVALESS
jgi:DNA-binding beta-propeller fold protein YncE